MRIALGSAKRHTHSRCTKCQCHVNISEAKQHCKETGCPVKTKTALFRGNPTPPLDTFDPVYNNIMFVDTRELPPATDGKFEQEQLELFFHHPTIRPRREGHFRARIADGVYLNIPISFDCLQHTHNKNLFQIWNYNQRPAVVIAIGTWHPDTRQLTWDYVDGSQVANYEILYTAVA